MTTKGINVATTYWEEESTYGECIIYHGLKPVYMLWLVSNISGNFIEEFDYYVKKNKVNSYKFLNKILACKTDFSISPKVKSGICFYIHETKDKTLFSLDYLDFDQIWRSLSSSELEKIVKSL